MAINLPIISEWNPKGINKAIADFKKLETNGKKAAFAIKKAAVPAGLALAAMGAFAFDAVKAFAEDDAAAQKLATTLRNATKATNEQVASVEKFITKTSIAAAVADDELRPALASLVRGTGDVTKAQDLLNLALDISAGTGKDLGSVSDALSKAFNGNFMALKKLDPALAELIKSGASTDEVFAALSKTFADQASTAANTTAGKMKTLSIQMGELKESIGAAVLPLVQKMLPALEKFATWAQENPKLVTILAAAMGVLAASIVAVNIAMALNPYVAVAAAVIALSAGLAYLYTKFQNLRPLILGLVTGPFGLLIAAFVYLKKVSDDAMNFVVNSFRKVLNWAKIMWPFLTGILTGPFNLAVAAVVNLKKVSDDAMSFVVDSFRKVFNWAKIMWPWLTGILTGPFTLAVAAVVKMRENIIKMFSLIFNGIKATMGFIANVITAPFKAAFNAIAWLWNNTVGKLSFTIPSWVPGGIGGKGWNVPDIPMLAEGGIVTGPTLAMIGEGREPEAVIPLSKLGSMGFGGGGGNTITVNVNGGDPNSIVRALQQYVRNTGPLPVSIQ